MGLAQALTSAVGGLRVTQSGLALVASNIANAETPGYVKKTAVQVAAASGDVTIGVRLSSINRELDQYLQRQLRTETSGGAYASTRTDFFQRLQGILGQPGADNALETVFNNFVSSAQALSTSPDSSAARYSLLTAGQTLAQHLNGMTADIQGLRSDAELGLADAVNQVNSAMRQIAAINRQLGQSSVQDATAASLQDQRDFYIDQLSQLMDIKVVATDHGKVNIFTRSGTQLVGDQASVMTFDPKGSLGATALWDSDPAKRGTGTIMLDSGSGSTTDLIAANAFGSGKIAALVEMRDHVLVDAQAQVDQIAAGMSRALSDRTVAGAAVTAGAQAGFDVDIGSLLAGNTINLAYTDTATNTQRQVTIVRIDDPGALPLPPGATPNPTDKVIGVDFSGGMAAIIAQINSALGSSGLQFSNTGGTTLRVLDSGAGGPVKIDALSTTVTTNVLTSGSAALPFFLDGAKPYSGALTAFGPQSLGFAGRITINPALLTDPSRLVVYQTSPLTAAADPTRPNFLLNQLTQGMLDFDPQAGVGTASAPFSGSLQSYIRQMISQQGEAAATADSLNQGQQVVVSSLQQRYADKSNVSIDEEMANLLKLQTAYGANARVLSAVRDMLDQLLKS
ncbi:MAG: flagellar hook-associated protein FlgK [Alphaproteobacteria bacterium]|nr:MAG: flagellar hook-associated protein FlgK [Alphaproteobacteria bacterium]